MQEGYFQHFGKSMIQGPLFGCVQFFGISDGRHDVAIGIGPHGACPTIVQVVGGVVLIERTIHVMEESAIHIGYQVLYHLILPVGSFYTRLVDDTFLDGRERHQVGLVVIFLQIICISSFCIVEFCKIIGAG